MTSASNELPPDDGADGADGIGTGGAADQPRRGASAQFTIGEAAGQQAAMRHAMDPANESLAEALRLSYRVLQVAILVLVVVFFFSGFQSVREGQTGVKTVFGKIVGEPGLEQVHPGLQPFWPYPVGEIVLVDQKRVVELRREFWPKLKQGQTTIEQATAAASAVEQLIPGMDSGMVLTADGDMAHVQVVAEYTVEDAVLLLSEMDGETADLLVRNSLKSATIEMAAQFTLPELVDGRGDQPAQVLRSLAQSSLDDVKCGIKLTSVTIPQKIAPLAVRAALAAVQESRVKANTLVENAQQEANSTLVGAAGPRYGELLDIIAEYESNLTREDLAGADAAMAKLGGMLEGADVGGEVARIIARAQAHESAITSQLANEVRRLKGLSSSFRENPTQLVRQQWLDGLRSVMDSRVVEVFSAPTGIAGSKLAIVSSSDVMQTRRNAEIEAKKRRAAEAAIGTSSFQLGNKLIGDTNKPGRKLDSTGTKGFGRD